MGLDAAVDLIQERDEPLRPLHVVLVFIAEFPDQQLFFEEQSMLVTMK